MPAAAPGTARVVLENPLVRAGVVLSVLLVSFSLIGPVLPLPDPYEQDILHRLDPPTRMHWLGTDTFGRDVLARLVQASRNSLIIALMGIVSGMLAGTILGVLAGYIGGALDKGVSEFINVFLAFPPDVLGILVLVALGGGYVNTAFAIGMAFVPRFARLARASTLSLREQVYVEAGRALGVGRYRLMARYILPGVSGTIVVTATVWIATAIRAEAGLSFLGLGVQPPRESWGSMIGQGLANMLDAPWVILCPTLAIMYAVVSFNMVGDGLRDLIDPRTRNT
ncbi:MAG: ABC transporter permease [Candidatus Rokuibacteriota bacterium]